MAKKLKLVVATPSTNTWMADFGMCLAMMANDLARPIRGFDEQAVRFVNKKGSILPQLRNQLMRDASAQGATHVLWIDSDQTFPRDTARRLLAHDVPVVACNIATKTFPSNPTARTKSEARVGGDLVYSHNQSGLQRVWRVGTGIMLVRMSALEGMEQPFFNITWSDALQNHVGEDWYFCEKLEKRDVAIRVDHDLSKEVGHVGDYTFDHDLIEASCSEATNRSLTTVKNGVV